MRNHKTNSSILHILSIKTAYHEGEMVEIDLNFTELGTITHKNTYLLLAKWQEFFKINEIVKFNQYGSENDKNP